MPITHRILIMGAPGSGKSTLARSIGAAAQLPVVHLDALYWLPGWKVTDPDKFRARIAEAAAGDAWVMDGSYFNTLDLRLPRATTLIWLDLPRSVYFRRALWRSISNYGRERPDAGAGNRERFEIAFFRDWVWTYPARRAAQLKLMAELPPGLDAITLRTPAAVSALVRALPVSLLAPGTTLQGLAKPAQEPPCNGLMKRSS
jgi:adenylate kinase family enzyme